MARNRYMKTSILVFTLSLPVALALAYFTITMVKLFIAGYLALEQEGYPAWVTFVAAPFIGVIGITVIGFVLRWIHDRYSASVNESGRALRAAKGLKYVTIIALVLLGLIGTYDFATQGSDNPLVWAFEGRFAPFFWVSVMGIIIWSVWPWTNESDRSGI